MIECKLTGRVTCLVEKVPEVTGLMCARYYVKTDPEAGRGPEYVKVIARQGQAYWALENLKPGMRVRLKGKCRAMLATLVVEQTSGRIVKDG